jgi:hypothetical protein
MGTYVTFEGGAGDLVSAASDIEGNIATTDLTKVFSSAEMEEGGLKV